MGDVEQQLQELDDEIVQSAARVHRLEYGAVPLATPPALLNLLSLLDPQGEQVGTVTPDQDRSPARR